MKSFNIYKSALFSDKNGVFHQYACIELTGPQKIVTTLIFPATGSIIP